MYQTKYTYLYKADIPTVMKLEMLIKHRNQIIKFRPLMNSESVSNGKIKLKLIIFSQ